MDYYAFEMAQGRASYVERLVRDFREAQSRRGHITEFINSRTYPTESVRGLVRRAVTNGLKRLWLVVTAQDFPRFALIDAIFYSTYEDLDSLLCQLRNFRHNLTRQASVPEIVDPDFRKCFDFLDIKDDWLERAIRQYQDQYDIPYTSIERLVDIARLAVQHRLADLDSSSLTSPRSPSLPQNLSTQQRLLHFTKLYFSNHCRSIAFNADGILVGANGKQLHNTLCNDFDSYCFTASMMLTRGNLHSESREAFSRACSLVKSIIEAEHPRTLVTFFEVFIHLAQKGLLEISTYLRGFVKTISATVTREGHPWSEICRLLGELDSDTVCQVMAQVWELVINVFEAELPNSRLTISIRLDYIKRVYVNVDCLQEERLLRQLLARFDSIPGISTPRVMLNLAHNLNRQTRHPEAEHIAFDVSYLLEAHAMYAERIVERIECIKIIAHSRFHQGEAVDAEKAMQTALQMIDQYWGRQHAWYLEFMNVLEGWFRAWGWKDADALQRGMQVLLGSAS